MNDKIIINNWIGHTSIVNKNTEIIINRKKIEVQNTLISKITIIWDNNNQDIFITLIDSISELYLQVFSNPTWNNWKYDKEKKISIDTSNNQIIRTLEEQKENIKNEIKNKILLYDFIKINENIVGFVYWWKTNIINLNSEKFKLDFIEQNILYKNIKFDWIQKWEEIIYLSQLWLLEEYRWNGFGKILITNFINKSQLNWYKYIILKTSQNRDLPYKFLIKNYWAKAIYKYDDFANNVILLIEL
jgi:ribosomal protein S18 acetylase RimI-like enzyme